MIFILLALCFVIGAVAHPPMLCEDDPICPNISTVANFDKNRYGGIWWEQAQSTNASHSDLKCFRTEYTFDPEKNTVHIYAAGIDRKRGGTKASLGNFEVPTDQAEAAKFTCSYSPKLLSKNHWILDTDYDTYSLVYSCDPESGWKAMWLMTRKQDPTDDEVRDIMWKAHYPKFGIQLAERSDQWNCNDFLQLPRNPSPPLK